MRTAGWDSFLCTKETVAWNFLTMKQRNCSKTEFCVQVRLEANGHM